mmetsp:Transcript_18323/g.40739  ORF Transcript_18323/g.40739 Transcript_18323/m.40739 type:complete len:589 (-) Transcript_18323:165-1931(-)
MGQTLCPNYVQPSSTLASSSRSHFLRRQLNELTVKRVVVISFGHQHELFRSLLLILNGDECNRALALLWRVLREHHAFRNTKIEQYLTHAITHDHLTLGLVGLVTVQTQVTGGICLPLALNQLQIFGFNFEEDILVVVLFPSNLGWIVLGETIALGPHGGRGCWGRCGVRLGIGAKAKGRGGSGRSGRRGLRGKGGAAKYTGCIWRWGRTCCCSLCGRSWRTKVESTNSRGWGRNCCSRRSRSAEAKQTGGWGRSSWCWCWRTKAKRCSGRCGSRCGSSSSSGGRSSSCCCQYWLCRGDTPHDGISPLLSASAAATVTLLIIRIVILVIIISSSNNSIIGITNFKSQYLGDRVAILAVLTKQGSQVGGIPLLQIFVQGVEELDVEKIVGSDIVLSFVTAATVFGGCHGGGFAAAAAKAAVGNLGSGSHSQSRCSSRGRSRSGTASKRDIGKRIALGRRRRSRSRHRRGSWYEINAAEWIGSSRPSRWCSASASGYGGRCCRRRRSAAGSATLVPAATANPNHPPLLHDLPRCLGNRPGPDGGAIVSGNDGVLGILPVPTGLRCLKILPALMFPLAGAFGHCCFLILLL